MADRSYPLDAMGNELRKGDLVRVTLQSPALNFRIVQVDPAGTLSVPAVGRFGDGGGMPLRGTMILVATMPVDFDAGSQLIGMFKLVDPDPEAARDLRGTGSPAPTLIKQ
jgi:hypothetical protein